MMILCSVWCILLKDLCIEWCGCVWFFFVVFFGIVMVLFFLFVLGVDSDVFV